MKNILLYYFLLLNATVVLANYGRIKEFQSPTLFPYNGFIIVETTDTRAPFAMIIKGLTTGYVKHVHDVLIEYKFDSLGPDFYEIEIIPSYGCDSDKLTHLLNNCDRLKIIPNVKHRCYKSSDFKSKGMETNGSISLKIVSGKPPFIYEWRDRDKNNQIVSRESKLDDIDRRNIKLVVKDDDGCMFVEDFNIFTFQFGNYEIDREDFCDYQSDYIFYIPPRCEKMNYEWSNGVTKYGYASRCRLSSKNTLNHSLTITEPVSQCSLVANITMPSGGRDVEIETLRNPVSKFENNGSVDFRLISNSQNGFLNGNIKLVIYKNEKIYSTEDWDCIYSHDYSIRNLTAGAYRVEWQDKEGCPIVSKSFNMVYSE